MFARSAWAASGAVADTWPPSIAPPRFPTLGVPRERGGAPHNGLAWLMRRIKSRISAVVFGLPGGRRDFHVQYKAKALRCQAMTVAGCTICRHRRQPDQNRDNRTHNTRSERLRRKLRGAFAWRTASWCRRARISVCSAARLRKLEAITAQRPTRTEFMRETTMISRMIVNYAFADRTEFSVRTGAQTYF